METLLARGYEHLQSLDSGGQANVYKALKNGKPCAIKVTEVKNVDDFGKLDRDLRREVEITSRLKHPNCMAIWEIFRTKSKVYTVMPQCKGSIGALVRKSGPRCEWNAKSWFCDIVRAVRYLHDNRVAHRDLKLDNVLLDDFDNPIVADFGLSTYITYDADGQLQLNRSFCGTRSHQSPQILKKIPYNVYKSDIWALGVMLFILVNQDYPFNRKEGPNVMYAKQMTREYHLRRDIEPKLSTDIKDLISKLLEPDEPKRLDIWAIGQHPFFPVIYQEADLKIDKARKTLGLRR